MTYKSVSAHIRIETTKDAEDRISILLSISNTLPSDIEAKASLSLSEAHTLSVAFSNSGSLEVAMETNSGVMMQSNHGDRGAVIAIDDSRLPSDKHVYVKLNTQEGLLLSAMFADSARDDQLLYDVTMFSENAAEYHIIERRQ